jgi:hypothetical protein
MFRQRFADAAVDNALQNLYTSAASSDGFIASDTVIPGSQPDEKPDEVIEGRKGLQRSTHSPSSNTSDEEDFTRGPVCPTAIDDDCHCVWKCSRLSQPEWSNTEWPTLAKLQHLKFMLEGLVCRLRMEPPGTEVNIEAVNFLPLPAWASKYSKRHPFLACIDLDICRLSSPDFVHGLQRVRDQIKTGDKNKIQRFVNLFLDTIACNDKLKEILGADARTLDALEERIKRMTSKEISSHTTEQLVDFTHGIHLGLVVQRAKEAWSLPYKEEDPLYFMKTLISEVDKERKNLNYCREWLTHLRSLDYTCLTAIIEGSLPLRLQKICYLIDSIREFCFGWENHRHRYMNGMCMHEIGWMQRPENVTQVVLDILSTSR